MHTVILSELPPPLIRHCITKQASRVDIKDLRNPYKINLQGLPQACFTEEDKVINSGLNNLVAARVRLGGAAQYPGTGYTFSFTSGTGSAGKIYYCYKF